MTLGISAEAANAIMLKRFEFVKSYCAEKGWDKLQLTAEQIMEIRSQDGWKNAR